MDHSYTSASEINYGVIVNNDIPIDVDQSNDEFTFDILMEVEDIQETMNLSKENTVDIPSLLMPKAQDLITSRKLSTFESVVVRYQYSDIVSSMTNEILEDPATFRILCTIRNIASTKALCDLGMNINMMHLELGILRPTSMR
ncbi:hypothetical protein HAX54_017107 [Datura stramonium]|uniref:Uncharacterized protein n=1 Tax=Datura stramonium TaxID=4076 RepID=A0ABS8UM87_DATST|nr:hypothetical protein [Datura stramonium]